MEPTQAAPLWAHSPAKDDGKWHKLDDHLHSTAVMARGFAKPFGRGAQAFWVGLVHDIGKAHPGFQRYLRDSHAGRRAEKCPHAIWGAALTFSALKGHDGVVAPLVLPVDGHHRGLMDWGEVQSDLRHLINTQKQQLAGISAHLLKVPELASLAAELANPGPGAPDLGARMLLSALIDADRTDTARHFGTFHEETHDSVLALAQRLEADQDRLQQRSSGKVNNARRAVYEACLRAAESPPGFYRLTVPTGGGKTRSAMAFALRHAATHAKQRVIVAIPYTSIIEQNAQVYREIFGDDNVLEHHSQAVDSPGVLNGDEHEQGCFHDDGLALRHRLATERWTHPIVVTTTVRLFESLFTNRPSDARRLHRIANSVIILDEFQAFPPELLEPTLDVLRDLVSQYRVTVVFCTATQPALETLPEAARIHATEIVPDPGRWFAELKRVTFDYRTEALPWGALAVELQDQPQALVVLNTRRQALEVLGELQARQVPDLFHLSTLLCGTHRGEILGEVRRRLKEKLPVRLVSTQVVEAGVDVDFPVAYRAVGPVDRILQVAGRCNREGKLVDAEDKPIPGRVVLFRPEMEASPTGPYRTGFGLAERLLDEHGPAATDDLGHLQSYFRELYQVHFPCKKGTEIQDLRRDLCFEKVAHAYRLIDQDTVPVVVDYRKQGAALARNWATNPTGAGWRALQPYIVNMYRKEAKQAEEDRWITPLTNRLGLWTGAYDPLFGIQKGLQDPTDLIQ